MTGIEQQIWAAAFAAEYVRLKEKAETLVPTGSGIMLGLRRRPEADERHAAEVADQAVFSFRLAMEDDVPMHCRLPTRVGCPWTSGISVRNQSNAFIHLPPGKYSVWCKTGESTKAEGVIEVAAGETRVLEVNPNTGEIK